MVGKLFVDDILVDWEYGIKLVLMKEWSENKEDLVDFFGKVCDDWLEYDFCGWIGVNRCVFINILYLVWVFFLG